jgi:hypothetical protein
MDTILLAIQAKILMWTGLGWIGIGLWLGFDPLTVACRAALAALLVMWLSGKMLRQVSLVIEERAAADAAEAQLAAEKAAEKAEKPLVLAGAKR